jgi:ABC-type sugar transport system ATPase subunit
MNAVPNTPALQPSSPPFIRFCHVTKRFPGVQALRDVSFDVAAGSCHALVGENGAGKSTLGKILAGIHVADEGEVRVGDRVVRHHDPSVIGMVHQELAFCENLSVAENLCLGDLPARGPFFRRRQMLATARERLAAIQADIEPTRTLGELPVSQQQLVQIAAAVARGAKVLIFDEPTSSLSQVEAEHLFALIKRLQATGTTCLYVSHRLEEIFRLCDTITVLRDGQHVATKPAGEFDQASLVQAMIGRSLEAYFPGHLDAAPGEELLRVEGYFTLRAGEVLGLAGLVGAGRTELAEAIFGLRPLDGKMLVRDPQAAMQRGIGLVPEDRKRHGLVLMMTAKENISLPVLETLARFGWIRARAEQSLAQKFFDALRVRAPHTGTVAASLSGGNQQKLVVAKWLAANCRVLIVDEPTRGVDVGAKAEIHGLIDDLARHGSGVLLISSELPEILNLSTRILVMRAGKIAAEVPRAEATQEKLLRLMAGLAE